MGVWDYDGHYKRFKTLGAKRYIVEYDDGEINITVSGLNKKVTVPYLLDKYGKDGTFENFNDGLYIPAAYTGKNTHTYIDEVRTGILVDYLGTPAEYSELSAVHLEESEYSLSLSDEYIDYLLSIEYI